MNCFWKLFFDGSPVSMLDIERNGVLLKKNPAASSSVMVDVAGDVYEARFVACKFCGATKIFEICASEFLLASKRLEGRRGS
uniref:Uncharacterized protein n=1 Tax=Romanomermis culicivorax TaxID=13658 RepID=A0A915JHW2_ROMCU